jgi:hypothetical protein
MNTTDTRPKVGDDVIAIRKGSSFEKDTVGKLMRQGGIDSENYYFVETNDGRMIGPSLEDYWAKHTKE